MSIRSSIMTTTAALGTALMLAAPVAAQDNGTVEQTIELEPGWNAVYMNVDPVDRDIRRVFSGVPVASVWRWIPDEAGSDFVRDPSEGLDNIEGWFAWFPEPRPEAFLSNLFRIDANQAYLIELEGNETREIVVEGRPRFQRINWETDSFTLTGLSIDPQAPPTFAEFFERSSSHQGQPIYQLDPDGSWHEVNPATTAINDGEAYWVRTQGSSRFQGKMNLVLDSGDSLEFSAALTENLMVLRNRSDQDGTFLIRRVGGDTMPLAWQREDPETGEASWPTLRNQLVLEAPAGEDVQVTLAILREQFTSSRMEQVIEVTDEQGQRILLHIGGNTIQPLIGPATQSIQALRDGDTQETVSYAGLWVGDIEVDAVSESQQAGVTPTPTRDSFVQRVIVHVDSSGQARLLKDVIQMWEDGTTAPSAFDPDFDEVDEPGRYVLLTDKNLISLYSGAALRGGRSVGLRYSTIGYDFEGTEQDLSGGFGPGEQLNTTLVTEPDFPTNPFLHRYHPDHDNLDAQFLNFEKEAYQVSRDMRLIFTEEDPLGRRPPGWGDSIVGGVYEGSLTGLHRNTIFTSGIFRMRRISAIPVLNQ
ncbi:hypothetical protein IC757_09635 [Wenzhouxiangella sp. AB-CW3]|uniref:hypothetical protein n=1 Tax=Wenzhouxiangella sp. AB-CW3 TaxID=2771012 RepID=UPI00168B0433|nr:hypothetical protein [Wenzhouxiangella sp. AB-CW3]QOC21316.1 hypothetical protein IC757_09635 [Wenzhouxiangella sp. AB-CW3]